MKKSLLIILAVVAYIIQFKIIWDSNTDITKLKEEVKNLKKENEDLYYELENNFNEEEL